MAAVCFRGLLLSGEYDHYTLKLIGAEISIKTSHDSVEIHDEPVIADSPVSPNVTLNLVIGTVLGFLVSPLFALPLMVVLNRLFPARTSG